jgi:hypothetical protein
MKQISIILLVAVIFSSCVPGGIVHYTSWRGNSDSLEITNVPNRGGRLSPVANRHVYNNPRSYGYRRSF